MESETIRDVSVPKRSNSPLRLAKYSIGVGDRFAHQAEAQLRACILAAERGVEIIPVWNKSNREHGIVGSSPQNVRDAADRAVSALGWQRQFHVDADHINLSTVDRFISSSDFFTIDVASAIDAPPVEADLRGFVEKHPELVSPIRLADGILQLTQVEVHAAAAKYLGAAREAGNIYRHIAEAKGAGTFISEVSMDETDAPQTPGELAVILAALADEQIPLQTIAPKFTGRFNKGVDYVGDVAQFEKEFRDDIAVIAWAVKQYGFHPGLKLSVHSGSDKFSIYPAISRTLRETGAGLHLKTAGTTWLEELIGMAEADGEGLELAKHIYEEALSHREELCAPYATVIDIDEAKLPSAMAVKTWSSDQYVHALRHDPKCSDYNPSVRQLLHVGYKIAAKLGPKYLDMLEICKGPIARNVTTNLYERHILPVFLGVQ
jgi:hypothetical protein